MYKKFYLILIIPILIIFSGCRWVEWGKRNFYQGCKVDNCANIARAHIRTIRVYDQFVTLGIFDAMWLSKDVIKTYSEYYSKKHFYTNEEACNFFENKYKEYNKDNLSFYILAYTPDDIYDPLYRNEAKNAPWKVTLRVNNEVFEPCEINKVDLNLEFKYFFESYLSKFKTTYLVKFPNVVTSDIKTIVLCFSSINNNVSLSWEIDNCGKLIRKEDDCCIKQEFEIDSCEACCNPIQICEINDNEEN